MKNDYCKHATELFYEAYKSRTFDQADVHQFLVAIRDYAPPRRIVREVGNFLAHPEQKDRGILLSSTKSIMDEFDALLVIEKSGGRTDVSEWPKFEGMGTDNELISDLTEIFSQAGLSFDPISRDDLSFRDLKFCVIFLLGGFKLKFRDQLLPLEVFYSRSLTLRIKAESEKYPGHFALLPILVLPHVWRDAPSVFGPQEHKLDKHIARRFRQGYLGAISYELDKETKSFELDSFEQGQVWPLPDFVQRSRAK
jgi:hypothetical protein